MARKRSAVVLEHLLETLAGKEDAALDGAEWEVHLLGDFIVFVTGHMHGERHTVLVGEGIDGRGDFTGCHSPLGGVKP